jgi:hypothetical protein
MIQDCLFVFVQGRCRRLLTFLGLGPPKLTAYTKHAELSQTPTAANTLSASILVYKS